MLEDFDSSENFNHQWKEYFLDCSFSNEKKLLELFNRCYKNHPVCWKGIPTRISENQVEIVPYPFQKSSSNLKILLFLNNSYSNNANHKFEIGKLTSFCGIIRGYGLKLSILKLCFHF